MPFCGMSSTSLTCLDTSWRASVMISFAPMVAPASSRAFFMVTNRVVDFLEGRADAQRFGGVGKGRETVPRVMLTANKHRVFGSIFMAWVSVLFLLLEQMLSLTFCEKLTRPRQAQGATGRSRSKYGRRLVGAQKSSHNLEHQLSSASNKKSEHPAMAHPTEIFARYRANVAPHYNPWLHAGFVFGYGIAGILLA